MSTETLVAIIIAAVVVVLLVCAFVAWRVTRRRHLKKQFGPEYERVVEEEGAARPGNGSCANGSSAMTRWRSSRCRQRIVKSTPRAGARPRSGSWTGPRRRSTKPTGS